MGCSSFNDENENEKQKNLEKGKEEILNKENNGIKFNKERKEENEKEKKEVKKERKKIKKWKKKKKK